MADIYGVKRDVLFFSFRSDRIQYNIPLGTTLSQGRKSAMHAGPRATKWQNFTN